MARQRLITRAIAPAAALVAAAGMAAAAPQNAGDFVHRTITTAVADQVAGAFTDSLGLPRSNGVGAFVADFVCGDEDEVETVEEYEIVQDVEQAVDVEEVLEYEIVEEGEDAPQARRVQVRQSKGDAPTPQSAETVEVYVNGKRVSLKDLPASLRFMGQDGKHGSARVRIAGGQNAPFAVLNKDGVASVRTVPGGKAFFAPGDGAKTLEFIQDGDRFEIIVDGKKLDADEKNVLFGHPFGDDEHKVVIGHPFGGSNTATIIDGKQTYKVVQKDGEVTAWLNGEKVDVDDLPKHFRVKMGDGGGGPVGGFQIRSGAMAPQAVVELEAALAQADSAVAQANKWRARADTHRVTVDELRAKAAQAGATPSIAIEIEKAYAAAQDALNKADVQRAKAEEVRAVAEQIRAQAAKARNLPRPSTGIGGVSAAPSARWAQQARVGQALGDVRVETAPQDAVPPANVIIGVVLGSTDAQPMLEHFGLDANKVSIIGSVTKGLPADKAGIRPYDIIVGVGGQPDGSGASIRRALRAVKPGQPVEFVVISGGETKPFVIAPVPRNTAGGGGIGGFVAPGEPLRFSGETPPEPATIRALPGGVARERLLLRNAERERNEALSALTRDRAAAERLADRNRELAESLAAQAREHAVFAGQDQLERYRVLLDNQRHMAEDRITELEERLSDTFHERISDALGEHLHELIERSQERDFDVFNDWREHATEREEELFEEVEDEFEQLEDRIEQIHERLERIEAMLERLLRDRGGRDAAPRGARGRTDATSPA